MGKVKQSLIVEQENIDLDYRPFKPVERLSDVEVSAAYLKPSRGLLDGREWTPSSQTDVTKTWRRFGWRPIAEIIAEGKEINKK
jgi:hypothetical protein